MIGKIVSHYKILEKLGGGGMGVVYKAEDTKLKRTVALKFLPAAFSSDDDAKKRFVNEAQAASSLQHHNICNIHDIDETKDGQIFICMDCYEGETLKKKIERGQIKTDEAIDIVVQVAAGLQKAHEKGIIHRDIKPANIFITNDGVVKILDFGLAKLSGQTMMTKMGETVGTIAYMSPEQTRGDLVDHRTDIWTLGVVFYEMITGSLPFRGDYEQAIIYSILNDHLDSDELIDKNIPKKLEDVIEKCLKKNPELRYQNMKEVIEEIKDLTDETIQTTQEKSILVLPFDDLSPGKDNEYFNDGLTEEIITDLSHIKELLVISRSSAMTFKGTKKSIPEIARAVNVKYVLEGSVRKAGNSLRITAQLINGANDAHLWAEKYNGTMDDIFDIQEKVSQKIVEQLKGYLTQEDKNKLAYRPSYKDIGVYEAYARARFEFWKTDIESQKNALRILDNAITSFGEHPLLLSGIGAVYWQYYHHLGDLNEVHLKEIEECASALFLLDNESSYGHRLTSYLRLLDGKTPEAINHLYRAMKGDPNDTETLLWLSYILAFHAGKPLAAKPIVDRWFAIDPMNPVVYASEMWVHWISGDIFQAHQSIDKWCKMEPANRNSLWYKSQLLAWLKRYNELYELSENLTQGNPDDIWSQTIRCMTLAIQGKKDEALNSVSKANLIHCWNDFGLPWLMCECYSIMEEKDESLRWLERSIDRGLFNYPLINELDPFLINIRSEDKYNELMLKVKYKWENLEV